MSFGIVPTAAEKSFRERAVKHSDNFTKVIAYPYVIAINSS